MIMNKMPVERILRSSVMLCHPEIIPFTQSSLEMTVIKCAFLEKVLLQHIRNHINFMLSKVFIPHCTKVQIFIQNVYWSTTEE